MITQASSKLVYTPKYHIPIGKPILKSDGTYVLRVKKANKNEYDEIPLDALCTSVVTNAEREKPNDREPPQCRHPSPSINSSI